MTRHLGIIVSPKSNFRLKIAECPNFAGTSYTLRERNFERRSSIVRPLVFTVLTVFTAALLAPPVTAQITDELIGTVDAAVIAVPPPAVAGNFEHAKAIASTAHKVLEQDLRLSRNTYQPNLHVLNHNAAYTAQAQRDAQSGRTGYTEWKALGAAYVIRLDVSGAGRQVSFLVTLEETAKRQPLKRFSLGPMPTSQFRAGVHGLSNKLIEFLTNEKGIAQSRLAFVRSSGKNTKEVYIVDYDGHSSSLRTLTNYRSITLRPMWSPDGRTLAYMSFRKDWADIYLHDIYGARGSTVSDLARFKGNNITPAWNPADPNELAVSLSYTGSPEIYLMSPKGKVTKRVSDTPGIDCSPAFSADGESLAWTSDRVGRRPQIHIADRDGGNVRRLSRVSGKACDLAVWSPVKIRGSYLIAFYAYQGREGHIFTVKPDGSDLRQITSGRGNHTSPTWSPDGMYLAYSSDRGGTPEIRICSYDGTPPPGMREHWRLSGAKGALSPAWSP